jgi:AcrR family transcriptional regulator
MSGEILTRSQARKSAIVVAAAGLFAARGFAAVGVDDIGEAVGVSGPAIYRHFRGKDAILAAVITHAAATLQTAAAAVQVPGGTEAVEELARALTTAALDGPTYLATYQRERHRLNGSDDEAVRALERRVLRTWRVALPGARPEFDQRSLLIRQAAVTGALSEATTRPAGVPRPRLDDLLAHGAVAIVLAPPPKVLPAVPAPRWTPPTGKRDEILAAALQRLAQRGFHGVGMDEIGEAAGISGPTVYHYYSSKAELLVDAFDRIGERVMAGADEAVRDSRSARDALDRLARSYTAIAADSTDLMVVTAREGLAVPDADRPRLARRRRRLRDRWGGVVGEVRPDLSEVEVRLLVRMAFPLANAAILADRGRERTDEIAALVVASMAWS